VLLKPLPFPGRGAHLSDRAGPGFVHRLPDCAPGSVRLQQQSTEVFEALGSLTRSNATMTGEGRRRAVSAYRVTPEFWDVMKRPASDRPHVHGGEDKENRALAS
jgi:hypothetical protein